jgi:predicted DNA-binding ribbon-helix-helix protein
VNTVMNLGSFLKLVVVSWMAAQLAASQEGLSSVSK